MTSAPAIVDLNLLPASERPTEVSGRAAALVLAFVLAIAGLAPLAVYAQRLESRASDMERRADEAQNHLDTLQIEFVRGRALRVEIDQAMASAASLSAERQALQQGARPLHDDLVMLQEPSFLPEGARITLITGELDAFRIEGAASDPLAAIAYARALAFDGGFASARLASFEPGADGGVFTLEVAR